jgi:transmembrane sensor
LEKQEYFSSLFEKYRKNQCSPAEVDELLEHFKSEELDQLFEATAREQANRQYPNDPILGQRLEAGLQKILSDEPARKPAPVRQLIFSRVAAVAIILLILAPISWILIQSRIKNPTTTQMASTVSMPEITPGAYKPVLTLSSGQQLTLDSAFNKTLASQGSAKITQTAANQIAYTQVAKPGSATNEYNTLTNPRGSYVTTLTLSDGTKVWLNAGSSITYPVAFDEHHREVKITGEAYFEVKHDAKRPFKVTTERQTIEDIGTSFNVNAYPDENETKTTLIEGSITINKKIIRPGEQTITTNTESKTTKADIESTMAWKNGQFILKGTDLTQLLKQISRWYDVDIEKNNKNANMKFRGSISRNVNLSTVIEALKYNGINCTLNKNKLTID